MRVHFATRREIRGLERTVSFDSFDSFIRFMRALIRDGPNSRENPS